jgi:hypothetical protein
LSLQICWIFSSGRGRHNHIPTVQLRMFLHYHVSLSVAWTLYQEILYYVSSWSKLYLVCTSTRSLLSLISISFSPWRQLTSLPFSHTSNNAGSYKYTKRGRQASAWDGWTLLFKVLIGLQVQMCAADVFGRTQNTFPIFQSIRVISASIEGIYI